jgi:hypothetical protein
MLLLLVLVLLLLLLVLVVLLPPGPSPGHVPAPACCPDSARAQHARGAELEGERRARGEMMMMG